MNKGEIVIYSLDDGSPTIDVKLDNDTLWLTQSQIAELFQCSVDNVGLHLKNLFSDGELDESRTTENFSVVRIEGSRNLKNQNKENNLINS